MPAAALKCIPGPHCNRNRLTTLYLCCTANYYLVVAVNQAAKVITIATAYYSPYLYIGDTLLAYAGNPTSPQGAFQPLGSTTVTNISGQVPNPSPQNLTSNSEAVRHPLGSS